MQFYFLIFSPIEKQYLFGMKLVQYNEYPNSTVDTDGLVL